MTTKEKSEIKEVANLLQKNCTLLENLYMQSGSINLRWIKQDIQEKCIFKLNKLI